MEIFINKMKDIIEGTEFETRRVSLTSPQTSGGDDPPKAEK